MSSFSSILILIVIALFAIGFIWLAFNRAKIKGKMGEFEVSAILATLSGNDYIVINNITLPSKFGTTQIDHIVVSIYGIFVIETKNYTGFSAITPTFQCRQTKQSSLFFICEVLSQGTILLCSHMSRCKSFAIRLGKQPLRKKEQTESTLRMSVATFTTSNRPSIKASAHGVEADLSCVMVAMAHSMGAATIQAAGSR